MKKRDYIKKDGKIVFFPSFEEKILEKGLKYLEENRFLEAIALFEEAKQLERYETPDIYMGLVLAYSGAGKLEKAKELAREMMQKGIGDYFETVDLYLAILMQMHEYGEIISLIECLFEEREIPVQRYEHFANLLNYSRNMKESRPGKNEKQTGNPGDISLKENFLLNKDINQAILQVTKLADQNIRPYAKMIEAYLIDEQGHPFIKTLLLNMLKEQEYCKPVVVEKFSRKESFQPHLLKNFDEILQKQKIEKKLESLLEHDDPVLLQQIMTLIARHFFLLYPFDLLPDNPSVWAAAYHLAGKEYNGEEHKKEEICRQHRVSEKELDKAYQFIKKLEEISYPII